MTAFRQYRWPDGKSLELGKKTLVMGILNVTPDSFSDGGRWDTPGKALAHARQMVEDGADIIDIGAESSRPGFVPVSADEEWDRLAPFLEEVLPGVPVPVSVDTFKAKTARRALDMGAHILNDIWGLQYEKEPGEMAGLAAERDVPIVVMHNRAATVDDADLLRDMQGFFRQSIRLADEAGLRREKLILDPGIGFGKTPTGNLLVLKRLGTLMRVDGTEYPLLLGTSRKSFIGAALGLPVEERMEATGATCVLGAMKGCAIVRVHDVKPIARMCRMIDAIAET